MPIPAEILAVARPRNTFVAAYGKSKDRYAVRKYVGCRYDHGRHIPIKGPTIGHIRDGKFIPTENDPAFASRQPPPADLKDWARPLLCERIFANMIPELKEEYREDEALKIWCVAVLRVCNPGARDYELEEMYESSFLSELHPGVALSKNTVSALHKEVGRTCSRIVRFMRRRAEAIAPESHILLDGTLKSDESRVNSLSDFSRKARTKGTRDISVLYAFDMDKMEPVCSKCHPGNMLDMTAYGDFVRECGVKRGVIVADKGFPASAAAECRKECPGLHYLNPVRRNILRSLASWARAKVFPAQTPAEEVLAFQPDGVSSPTARPTPPPSPTPLRTSRSYWVSGLLTSLHSPAVNRQPRRRIDKRRATRPFDLSTF